MQLVVLLTFLMTSSSLLGMESARAFRKGMSSILEGSFSDFIQMR